MLNLLKLTLLVFFCTTCNINCIEDNVIHIGAIFDSSSPQSEHAFRHAISKIRKLHIFDGYTVKGHIHRIPPKRPFEAIRKTCDLLSLGVVGIVGPTTKENADAVRSVSDGKEILLLDVYPEYRDTYGTNLNLHPHPGNLLEAYLGVLNAWGWRDFTIFYEDDRSLVRMSEVLKLKDNEDYKVVIKQLDRDKTGNYRPALKDALKSASTHFLIDCSTEILPTVLKHAQQVGLMTSQYHFLFTNLDLHTIDLSPYQYSETKITGLRLVETKSEEVVALAHYLQYMGVYEGDPESGSNVLVESALIEDAVVFFARMLKATNRFSGKPLFCDENDAWEHGQSVVNIMKTSYHKGLTGLIQFDEKARRSDFSLDVYQLTENGIVDVVKWNRSASEIPEIDNGSLTNRTFIVMICITEPYAMLKESPIQLYGNERFEGYGVDLIAELAAIENFNYTFVVREDGKNGEYNPETNEWEGMIGDIMKNRADLGITDLTVTAERETAVDFTSTFMNLGISILYQKPSKAPPSFFSFADPFAIEVWALLVTAYFGVSVALFIMGRLCPSEWTNPYPCIEEPEFLINQFSMRNAFWFTTGAIMQQGSEIAPIAVSTRMVSGFWWFFTLIMVSSYTANLAAFLTTENPDNPFDNINELVERGEKLGIKFGAKAGGATANFFKNSNADVYGKAWQYMDKHHDEVMVKTNKDGVLKAESGKYAFFMESTSIEYETQRRCNLTSYGGRLDEKGYAIAMRKNSTYRNALTTAILKLQESGRLRDLKRKWWEERRGGGQCLGEDDKTSEAQALGLKNVGGVFGVTIMGVVAACFLVFVEMTLHVVKVSLKYKSSIVKNLKQELSFCFKFKGMVKPALKIDSAEGSEQSRETFDDGLPGKKA